MNYVGYKIYFDKTSGEPIQKTPQKEGVWARQSTEGEDLTAYKTLSERNRETFEVLELPYGAYAQDFAICTGYRVNPETKELEFIYPDENEPDVEQPYIQPLSEAINEQMDYLVDVDFRLSMIELGL